MYLIINTSQNDHIQIILAKSEDDFKVKKIKGDRKQGEKLLSGIEVFLKANKLSLKDIKGIGAVSGPGGFTSLRIGIVTANTLAFALKIPVAGLSQIEYSCDDELVEKLIAKIKKAKKSGIVLPEYGREPNIGG